MDTYHRWMEVVIPGTLAGLPMGLQLHGKAQADLAVLQLAYA
jgi:amidase